MSAPRRDFWIGVAITVALIVVKDRFEHGVFGLQIQQMTINLQQLRLADAFRHDPRVVVVDISSLGHEPRHPPTDTELVTDRAGLEQIIAAVADASPAAIGVDVLLDPPAGSPLTAGERRVLDTCLEVRRDIPILVAIFDSVVRGPDAWLGERRYRDLAAYALVPRPSEIKTTMWMARTVTINVDGQEYKAHSLAQALALELDARELERASIARALAHRFRWLVVRDRPVKGDYFETGEFLINYGILETLESRVVRASSPKEIAAASNQLRGKVVFIGRGQIDKTTDVFNVPARSEPVAGVYVHAASTYTLIGAPLFHLTRLGRWVADAVVALIPLLIILRVRTRQQGSADPHAAHRLATTLTIGMAIAVFFVGYLFVVWTRIMWTDCLMVSAALLLHGPLERLTLGAIARLRGRPVAAAGGGHA
jgi:CHASE2 domain-containing sensor protein